LLQAATLFPKLVLLFKASEFGEGEAPSEVELNMVCSQTDCKVNHHSSDLLHLLLSE
jgi:hypothetical protein